MGESGTSTKAKAARVAAGSGAILSLGASLVATAAPAGADSFEVTSNADAGAGTLRQAILDANANGEADTITFAPGLGAIALTTGAIPVTADLVLTDPEGDITIDAGGNDRIFYISSGAQSVTISGLTLTGGATTGSGGAFSSRAQDLTITNSTITGNEAGGHGGGFYSFGADTVTVTDTTFEDNRTYSPGPYSGSGYGGGFRVSDADSLVVTGSTFTGNTTGGDGGGFDADAVTSVTVTDSSFTGGHAGSDGGGISVYGHGVTSSVTISGVTATGNTSGDQAGGMVIQSMASGTVDITDSTFADNDGLFGGGVTLARLVPQDETLSVDVSIAGSTFSGNTADNTGGGLYLGSMPTSTVTVSTSTFDGNEADLGGGIGADDVALITVDASTLSGNDAGAGGGFVASDAQVTVTSSTISGNTAEGVGGGIAIYDDAGRDHLIAHSTITGNTAYIGGGLFLGGYGGTVTLDHDLIEGNVAIGDGLRPVALAGEPTIDEAGAAIFVGESVPYVRENEVDAVALDAVTLTNSLVNGSIAGVVVDGGGNQFNEAADLGPLADNGGPTQTHDLLAGSAALNAGDAAFAAPPATDQRGLPRVSNGRIDIGAVESQVQTPVVPPVTPPVAPPAQPVPAQPDFTG